MVPPVQATEGRLESYLPVLFGLEMWGGSLAHLKEHDLGITHTRTEILALAFSSRVTGKFT